MDLKCSNCNTIILSSNLSYSCSHYLCNNCLSRKILQQNFKPLTSKNLVELNCSCKGKITVPFKTCLDNISQPEIINNKNKKVNKCFYHKEYNSNIFCKDCKKFICKKCETDEKNQGNNHLNHVTITPEEYKKTIQNIKKNLRFKTYDQIMKFLDEKEDEIVKDFIYKCNESKKTIENIFKKIKEIQDKYALKIEQQKNNLKNIFLIIRKVYNNFYAELEPVNNKIDVPSFEFISKLNSQLSNITYDSFNFEEIDEISLALDKIDTSRFYALNFDFSKMAYEQADTKDLDEGVIVLCPLRCIKNSFACGTEKGKIKIFSKNEDDYEYNESGSWNNENENPSKINSITSLIEPNKMENYLISGGTDKFLRIFNITQNENKCKITCQEEFGNNGIILDIFQLSDGRISFSSSDKKITILEYDSDTKKFNQTIVIKNSDVGFEKCLSEIQIFENDESNKQLMSGGINGILKRWDISSGKLEEKIQFEKQKLLTCITIINNHKIAIGSEEGFIIIFDFFAKDGIKYINAHYKKCINALCFSKYSQTLFSCSKDRNIKIWNLETLKCTNILEMQHEQNVNDIVLCGNNLISCSIDKTIKIYSIEGNDENDKVKEESEEKYDDFVS